MKLLTLMSCCWTVLTWFQSFTVSWMFYAFFWVIPRHQTPGNYPGENIKQCTYLACCLVCLDSKEPVSCVWWSKDVTKSSGVRHVLCYEGYLVNWVVIQAVLQRQRGGKMIQSPLESHLQQQKPVSLTHLELFIKKNPTRCNNVSKSYYSIFIWSSTCFRRHTAHHQESKTALAASGFSYVEGCWTCKWWTLSGTVLCLTTSTMFMDPCIIVQFMKKNPTRCNNVSKSYYFIFTWSSTCFGRHTAHYQGPKTALAASGFSYVEGCWTCRWWTLSGTVLCLTTFHVWKTRGCQCSFGLMMTGGASPETCWASYKYGIIRFWYTAASCWIFF